VIAIFSSLAAWSAGRGADEITAKEVLAAWEKRQASVKSFQYACDVEELVMNASQHSPEPFSASPPRKDAPKGPVSLRSIVTFAQSGEKYAYSKEGQWWDAQHNVKRTIKTKTAFDGVQRRHITEGLGTPLGEVSTGKSARTLMFNIEWLAFWLPTHTVEFLRRKDYDLDQMTVSRPKVVRGGHDCAELTLRHSDPRSAWVCRVYVDPSRYCLPIAYEHELRGCVTYSASFEYLRDGNDAWRVSAIRFSLFDIQSGDPETSWSYKVKRCSINEPLDHDVFKIEFPNGTPVVDLGEDLFADKSQKYYIALGDGRKRQIAEDELGRPLWETADGELPERTTSIRPVATIGAIVLFAAMVALLWKRRRAIR
jgi:hypothetical protein